MLDHQKPASAVEATGMISTSHVPNDVCGNRLVVSIGPD